MLSCYLQRQTIQFMILTQVMFMKIFIKIRICLILVTTQKVPNWCHQKKVICKMKDKFVVLKSKMYTIVTVNNEEIKKQKLSIKMLKT